MRFAGDVNIGSFMSDTPAYDRVGSMAVGEDAENDVSQAMRNAYVADAGMRAQGAIARAEANADYITSAGAARGGVNAAAGFNGAGKVVGGIISKFGGGGLGGTSGGYNFDFFNSRGAFG